MAKSALEESLNNQIRALNLPTPDRELKFHESRKWRFDFAWPLHMIAVEVQGGTWNGGAHGRGSGLAKDREKLNTAQVMGWAVLQFGPEDIRSGAAITFLESALMARQVLVDIEHLAFSSDEVAH